MFANQSESHAMPEVDDLEEYEDDSEDDVLELYDGGDEELEGDDEAGPESSLDELLARRAAKGALEGDEEGGLLELASRRDEESGAFQLRSAPPKRPEFVCARCRLVKPLLQLSDKARSLCRDCA